jgi:uncharacterized Tic20 family protein
MRLQTHVLVAIGAVMDTVVAAVLMAFGLTIAAAVVAGIAIVGFVLAWVLWQRSH